MKTQIKSLVFGMFGLILNLIKSFYMKQMKSIPTDIWKI